MKKKIISMIAVTMTACLISLVCTNHGVSATGVADIMPAGGVALALEEGTSLDDIYVEQNSNETTDKIDQLPDYSIPEVMDISDNTISESIVETGTKTDAITSISIVDETDVASIATFAIGAGALAADEVKAEIAEEIRIAEEEEARDPEHFSNLVIAQVTNYVNVRDIPSEQGEVVGKLYDDSVGNFIEEENGWYKITSGRVTGYVKGEYCVTGEEAIELAKKVGKRMATVNTTTLKVRTEPSTDSAVLGLVPIEEDLVVYEELDGWVKVSIEEGEGYVSAEYVNLHTDFVKAESKAEEEARLERERQARIAAQKAAEKAAKAAQAKQKKNNNTNYNVPAISGGSSMGNAVAQYACQFVGNPYVYGGTSLTNGTDCSGFVMGVYKAYGVSLPHSSSADRSQGYAVEGGLSNAQPGDIVCYSGHVGIYIGGGQIVHASTARTGICISNASYRNVLAVRRIF